MWQGSRGPPLSTRRDGRVAQHNFNDYQMIRRRREREFCRDWHPVRNLPIKNQDLTRTAAAVAEGG